MTSKSMRPDRKPEMIAALLTLLVAVGLLVVLYCVSFGPDRAALAAESIPEEPDQEEVYIEPELLRPELDRNMEEADQKADLPEESEAEALGLPEPAETPEPTRQNTHSEQPKPTRSNENLVTQKPPSKVKTEPAKPNPNPDSRKTSVNMSGKFNAKPGSTGGRHGAAGSGGNGVAVNARGISGRAFHGYKESVRSTRAVKAAVSVRVTVGADGHVKSASLLSSGGAPADIANKCVQWARRCSWDARPGAADATGTITYNIVVNP